MAAIKRTCRTLLVFSFVIGAIPNELHAATQMAASCSYADVSTAMAAAMLEIE